MKKIISFLLCAIIACTFSLSATAKENSVENTFEEKEVIEFIHEEGISEELKAKIEHAILYGNSNDNARGILCTIFGHDLIETQSTTITHKARTNTPRCLEKIYEIKTCEDCDYTESTLIQSRYIYCCS